MSYLLTDDHDAEDPADAVVLGGTRYRLAARTSHVQLWCETDDCPRPADFALTCTDPWDGVRGSRHLCGACLDRLEREEWEAGAQPGQPAPATGSDGDTPAGRYELTDDEDGSGVGAAACMTVTFAAVLLLFCVVLLAEVAGGAAGASATAAAGCLRW